MSVSKLLATIEAYCPQHEKTAPSVSSKSVAWQLDHSLKVVNGVLKALAKSDPQAYKPSFSLIWLYIQLRGSIPRGKGKAPKAVQATASVSLVDLEGQLMLAKSLTAELEGLPQKAWFKHPLFGVMNKKSAIRFIEIHTQHHLKIVKDILATG